LNKVWGSFKLETTRRVIQNVGRMGECVSNAAFVALATKKSSVPIWNRCGGWKEQLTARLRWKRSKYANEQPKIANLSTDMCKFESSQIMKAEYSWLIPRTLTKNLELLIVSAFLDASC